MSTRPSNKGSKGESPRATANRPPGSAGDGDLALELERHQVELEAQNRQLRETQVALEESRSRYVDLYDYAPVAYVTLDRDGRIQEANLTAAGLLGLERLHLIGSLLVVQVEMGDRSGFRHHLRRCFEDRARISTELTFSLRRRARLAAQMVSTPLVDGRGEVVGCRTTLTDVTALKRSEQRLALLATASGILGGSPDDEVRLAEVLGVAVRAFADIALLDLLGEDGALRRVELAFARSDAGAHRPESEAKRAAPLGPAMAQVLATGRSIFIVDGFGSARSPAEGLELEPLLQAWGASSLMLVPLLSRGATLGVLTLVSTEAHRFTGGDLSVAEDLAARIATAIDSARLRRRAQAATKAREEVLAFVAHDLRNPIHAMMLCTEGLSPRPPGAERRAGWKGLDRMRRLADQMGRMIDDLLDVSSLDSGTLSLETATHEVHGLFADALESLLPLAEDKAVELELRVPAPPEQVRCDRDRVLQVLSNIVGNSLKFTPAGGKVTVGSGSTGEEVVIVIHDTGPGISPESLPRVFDKYWQADASARKGRGLGLYISRRIIEAHGGTIRCESRPEGGTTVSFSLPRASPAERDPD